MTARPYRVVSWDDSPASAWLGTVGTYKTLERARVAAREDLTSIPGGWNDRYGRRCSVEDRRSGARREWWGWPEDTTKEGLMEDAPVLLSDPLPDEPVVAFEELMVAADADDANDPAGHVPPASREPQVGWIVAQENAYEPHTLIGVALSLEDGIILADGMMEDWELRPMRTSGWVIAEDGENAYLPGTNYIVEAFPLCPREVTR